MPTLFTFEVGDVEDAFVSEQFEAADHHTGQERDRLAGIDGPDVVRRIIRSEIDFAVRDWLSCASRPVHIADIGETLRAQPLLSDVLWGNADARILLEADGGRFDRPLRSQRSRRADEPRGPRQ